MEVEFAWEVLWISSLLILRWLCVHWETTLPECLWYHIVFLSFQGKYKCIDVRISLVELCLLFLIPGTECSQFTNELQCLSIIHGGERLI